MEPGLQGACSGVRSPELGFLLCFGQLVEWGSSHRRATLPLRLNKRPQVDVLRINWKVESSSLMILIY